jgi:hypothetical protein
VELGLIRPNLCHGGGKPFAMNYHWFELDEIWGESEGAWGFPICVLYVSASRDEFLYNCAVNGITYIFLLLSEVHQVVLVNSHLPWNVFQCLVIKCCILQR